MPTPHIEAEQSQIAKIVLMPGDPLRAKFIADEYLSDIQQVNQVRNMFGYTGVYNNNRITIQSSGMGMPSMAIYAHELFHFYDVDCIIRVGTMGAVHPDVRVGDIIVSSVAYTDSHFGYPLGYTKNHCQATEKLLHIAQDVAKRSDNKIRFGNVWTSDHFYGLPPDGLSFAKEHAILGVEMETFALYHKAHHLNKKALAIFTVTDDESKGISWTPIQRQTGIKPMIELALRVAEAYI